MELGRDCGAPGVPGRWWVGGAAVRWRLMTRMRMISGAWLSMIFNVALAVGVSQRRVLLSSQGDLACGAGWVSSHARNLPSLGAGGHRIQQTHATESLGRLRMPPVLHRISPATIIPVSSLGHCLVHGHMLSIRPGL